MVGCRTQGNYLEYEHYILAWRLVDMRILKSVYKKRKMPAVILTTVMMACIMLAGCGDKSDVVDDGLTVEILNVSYDPTREFYVAYNELNVI